MKKTTLLLLLSIIVILTLTSCETRTGGRTTEQGSSSEQFSSSLSESEPASSSEPEEDENDEPSEPEEIGYKMGPYDEMLLVFGGTVEEPADAKPYLRTSEAGLYFTSDWKSPIELDAGSYFAWYMSMMWKEELTASERREKYKSPIEGDEGWFFPQELYEAKIMEYFDVTTEHLRSELLIYNSELKGYYLPTGGGIGERPEIVLRDAEENGDTVTLHIRLMYPGATGSNTGNDKVLTVKKKPGGGFMYMSWQSE